LAIKTLPQLITAVGRTWPVVADATSRGNVKMLKSFLGPAYRGLFQQCAKGASFSNMNPSHKVTFDWQYTRDYPELAKLYNAANSSQWNSNDSIDWSRDVDPLDLSGMLLPDAFCPANILPMWSKLSPLEKSQQRHSLLSWFLSQILHGEQAALYGAAQVMQAVPWLDGKLFGATQVVDEGRHVEVFHRYLHEKMEKVYEINENLYVLTEALMEDPRWDVKFLGMQIMIEGFGLGSFSTIRKVTGEPVLKDVLKYVIGDEARHVHYGVLALERYYKTELNEAELREREEWAFEVCLLLQRRFLAHEIYDEYYTHLFTPKAWDKFVNESALMGFFRSSMFRMIIPNLKRLGLMSERIRPKYEQLGLLHLEGGKAAPELSVAQIMDMPLLSK
jgi:hypothetical protein